MRVGVALAAFALAVAPGWAEHAATPSTARRVVETPMMQAGVDQLSSPETLRRAFAAGGARGDLIDAIARIVAEEYARERPAIEAVMEVAPAETFEEDELAVLLELWSDPRMAPLADRLAFLPILRQTRMGPITARVTERVTARIEEEVDQ